MHLIRLIAAGTLALGLSACVLPGSNIDYLLSDMGEFPRPDLSPQNFRVCMNNGCSTEVEASLTPAEWQQIRDIFAADPVVGAPNTAEGERVQIAFALARMEQLVARRVDTGGDTGGWFTGFGQSNQLDCVDEMANTATYITMMYDDGLLRFHRPGRRITGAFGPRGLWPHTVATVFEIAAEDHYVVDTWIKANGEVPYVMALGPWLQGTPHRDLVTGEELPRFNF